MKRILLVDGDIVLYRFAWAAQAKFDFDGEEIVTVDLNKAIDEVEKFLVELHERNGTKKHVLCFTGKTVFRYDVFPDYKSNRKDTEKPQLFKALSAHLKANHEYLYRDQLEADDIMGLLATKHPKKYIICTIDKDLDQIPGLHYNWRTQEQYTVQPQEGYKWFLEQVLAGDPVDGFKGIPGIGPVKAKRILDDQYNWETVVRAYEAHDMTEEDALVQARVARIVQDVDYDFDAKEPILWSPPE